MTWIKKYTDPLNFSPWKILLIDSLEKWGGDNILLLGKEGLNTVASTLNPFWKDILDNLSNQQNKKVIDIRIGNASDLITVFFPINVKSRQHQALSILLIL
jgi:hypothetical protein